MSGKAILDYERPSAQRTRPWVRRLYLFGIAMLFFGAIFTIVMGQAGLAPAFLLGILVTLIGLGLIGLSIVLRILGRNAGMKD
ncbi:MAG TPA: hypothetical protein VFC78_13165 [Tepidisphaeraceae bacterium]|nr:hypothetical protein [Tepidisphaeraceae bacterium]